MLRNAPFVYIESEFGGVISPVTTIAKINNRNSRVTGTTVDERYIISSSRYAENAEKQGTRGGPSKFHGSMQEAE